MQLSAVEACDLLSRFYVNLPEDEIEDDNRRFYHLEQAYWFYLDFCSGLSSELLAVKGGSAVDFVLFAAQLLDFARRLCHDAATAMTAGPCAPATTDIQGLLINYDRYLEQYKYQIPVAGCILIAEHNTTSSGNGWYAVMIQGVATPNLGFPKGKVNRGERLEDAAVRETYEEVGLAVSAPAGHDGWAVGRARFYPVRVDVPFDFKFAPRCRGEIEAVTWVPIVPLSELTRNSIRLTRLASLLWPRLLDHVRLLPHSLKIHP